METDQNLYPRNCLMCFQDVLFQQRLNSDVELIIVHFSSLNFLNSVDYLLKATLKTWSVSFVWLSLLIFWVHLMSCTYSQGKNNVLTDLTSCSSMTLRDDWREGSMLHTPHLDALFSLHLEQCTGWEMTPSGCLQICLQRIGEDCVQHWKQRTGSRRSRWWCCRGESRSSDTARTPTSFSDRSGIFHWFRDENFQLSTSGQERQMEMFKIRKAKFLSK